MQAHVARAAQVGHAAVLVLLVLRSLGNHGLGLEPPARLNGRYDALVIGSGIGGLTVAALLAELGRRVAVLEPHYTTG